MRLDQVMNQAGLGSRNQVKRLLKSCQVQVDGQVERRPNRNVDPGLQEIKVQGQTLTQPAETYWLLHKPQGVLTAVKDDRFTTVVDCLAPQDQAPGLYPVGRLDRSTTGLVFLTTNGPLGYRMLHPQYHVEKEYQVVVNGPLTQDHVASFAQGILIDQDRPCAPAHLVIEASGPQESRARLTIREGKFHQVKKMFLSVGVKVTQLHRLRMGHLVLDQDLAPGAYRSLKPEELAQLKHYL
ncbi:pseudouridine synthase [Abiotrophia defectiva]|uniref:pseudouridine synthase n=1 Tax=Abiotrophia defectiva TaxID=46125 RepID=UPI0028EF8F95|nr:pseudouridine synthase [Abiotrophia defectiva]